MTRFPQRGEVYVGTDRTSEVHVIGDTGGPWLIPRLLAVHASIYDALSECDERHGQRVEDDPAALADIGGIEAGLTSGEVRVNDGGTIVFVDPNEWFRTFPSMREAKAWLREAGYGGRL